MTNEELRDACEGREEVVLKFPPPPGRGCTRRLFGRRGPRGQILAGHPKAGQIVRFSTKAVLRYLDKAERESRGAVEPSGKVRMKP